jgi:hypothetical protein
MTHSNEPQRHLKQLFLVLIQSKKIISVHCACGKDKMARIEPLCKKISFLISSPKSPTYRCFMVYLK